ncbi:hypothetical protein NDA12_003249 [Ustilago hordei]|nr:hypothetical protein NDA12_003249 [Ustilago hordei]
MDLSGLSSSEQQAMSRIIEQKQMKDFLKLYTGLVERCFESFLKHSERVGARFGEENAKMMAQQQNK